MGILTANYVFKTLILVLSELVVSDLILLPLDVKTTISINIDTIFLEILFLFLLISLEIALVDNVIDSSLTLIELGLLPETSMSALTLAYYQSMILMNL